MPRSILAIAAIAFLAGGAALIVTNGRGVAQGMLQPDDPGIVAQGAALYAAQCASCHGAELEGEPDWRERGPDGLLPAPPHDETGHTWHHPDAVLIEITTLGTEAVVGGGYQSSMIGFGDVLSEAEIVAVLSYIKSTWPERVRAIHDRINVEAE